MAFGLKGKIPVFEKPALMLTIEKGFSKGPFTIAANSHFVAMKFVLEKDTARVALKKLSLSDLNTATSSGCKT